MPRPYILAVDAGTSRTAVSAESDAAVFETDDSAMTQEYVADDEF